MNIEDLNNYSFGKDQKKLNNATSFKQPKIFAKSLAYFVDSFVVVVIRMIIAVITVSIMQKMGLQQILETTNFKSPTLFTDLYQKNFFIYVLWLFVIVLFGGGLYYVFFLSSKYSATLGFMMFDIKLLDKNTLSRISIFQSMLRYVLYVMPIFLMMLILAKYFKNEFDVMFFIMCASVFLWYDFGIFFKIKIGVPDLLSKTILISTKKDKK